MVAKLDLTLTMAERNEGLAGSLEYSTDLFERGTLGTLIEIQGHAIDVISRNAHTLTRQLNNLLYLQEVRSSQIKPVPAATSSTRPFPLAASTASSSIRGTGRERKRVDLSYRFA